MPAENRPVTICGLPESYIRYPLSRIAGIVLMRWSERTAVSVSRRSFLQHVGRLSACLPVFRFAQSSIVQVPPPQSKQGPIQQPSPLSSDDEMFLQEIENANFLFFWEQASPNTGIVRDRCNVRKPDDKNQLGSIASTGFGLTAICIGEKRKFVSTAEAHARVVKTLRFLWENLPHHRGFFYH